MGGWRWAARAVAPAVILLATAAQAAPAAKSELSQIVERYIDWRGGPAFRADVKAIHETADVQLFGLVGKLETWQTNEHWREAFQAPGMSMVAVITAHGAWVSNFNGQVSATPDAYKYAKRDPLSAKALEGKDHDTVALLGVEQLDGRAWRVVRVSYGDADTYDAFIDPATGELGATRTVQKGQQTLDQPSDWRWVKGVREPFVTHEVSPAGDKRVETVTALDVGVRIDGALFAQPQGAGRLAYAAGRDSTDWIAFTGLDEGRIFVPVSINGHAATAILDSGANAAMLDDAFAQSVALKPIGALPLGGENAVGSGAMIPGVDIAMGGATLKGATVATSDLHSLGVTQQLLIGDILLNGAVLDIDFPNRRLALRDPETFRPPSGAIAVPLVEDSGIDLAPVSVDGGPTVLVVVDTGLPMAMRISPQLAKAQHLLAGKPAINVTAGGVGGSAPGQIASLEKVNLGGVDFTNVPVVFSDAWPSATYTDRVQGLLGIALLSRFRVIFDWSRGRLYLIPGPDATTAPFARDRLGVVWTPDGAAMRITSVYPGSPAARAGLKAGETIDAVDGKPAIGASGAGAWPPGTEVTLSVHAPAQTTMLTLADYY
jgi:predicted aspartyl protease